MVKRAVGWPERPIGGSRGQLEAQLEDLGANQMVWETSKGLWRVKLGGNRKI